MKKITLFVLILGTLNLVNITHIIFADTTLEVLDISAGHKQQLINISKQHVEEIVNGDFNTITNRFAPELLDILDTEVLEQEWEQIIRPMGQDVMGDYKGIYSEGLTSSFGLPAMELILEFELGAINTTIVYNSDNKIISISFSPALLSQYEGLISNEYFEEIKVTIGDEYELDGILTLPNNVVNPPVAILVQGYNQTDMDLTVGFLQPFRDIAHGLAENGIASIRYDKRYYQYAPTSNIITIQDEVLNDVDFAIKLADSYAELGDIYIVGFSFGGMLAPVIALENDNVAGIVSLAGTPRRIEDVFLDQNIQSLDMENITGKDRDDVINMIQELVNYVKSLDNTNLSDEDLSFSILGLPISYWISLNEINIPEILEKLDIPMLILQGEKDLQINANKDFEMWKDLLKNRNNVEFILYENLNHFFTTHIDALGFDQYLAPAKVDNSVIKDISNWINN